MNYIHVIQISLNSPPKQCLSHRLIAFDAPIAYKHIDFINSILRLLAAFTNLLKDITYQTI